MKPVIGISAAGGAMRGVIGGENFREIEARTGRPVRECVDILAGTSTGAIQCGLIASPRRLTAEDGLAFYYESGAKIFAAPAWKKLLTGWGMTGTRYSGDILSREITACVGDYMLDQAETRLLIPAADAINREPVFFKSWRPEWGTVKLGEALRASASAQTYFPALPMNIEGRAAALIDGGNFKNSPMACLAFEMIALWPGREIVVIHFGTGKQLNPKPLPTDSGAIAWAPEIFGAVSELQDDCDEYFCRRLAEVYPCRYYRFDIEIGQFPAMDDARPKTLDWLRAETRRQRNESQFVEVCAILAEHTL